MSEIINLGDRIIDESGNVVYFIDSLIELLYNGEIPAEILYPKENQDVLLFNKLSYENFDDIYYSIPDKVKSTEERKNDWFYPSKYDEIDLYEYFLNLCTREEERERVINEIQLFQSKGFEKFLEAHNKGLFDSLYTTNLSYIPTEFSSHDWFHSVDMSYSEP